jgi:hypothetical protein
MLSMFCDIDQSDVYVVERPQEINARALLFVKQNFQKFVPQHFLMLVLCVQNHASLSSYHDVSPFVCKVILR